MPGDCPVSWISTPRAICGRLAVVSAEANGRLVLWEGDRCCLAGGDEGGDGDLVGFVVCVLAAGGLLALSSGRVDRSLRADRQHLAIHPP